MLEEITTSHLQYIFAIDSVFCEYKNIEVKIGNSLGYLENSLPIYNNQKIYIGEELTFKHYNVSKGYFEVKIDNKLYDTKVFVK